MSEGLIMKQYNRLQKNCCASSDCVKKLNTSIMVQQELPSFEKYWLSKPKRIKKKKTLSCFQPQTGEKSLNTKISLKRFHEDRKIKQDSENYANKQIDSNQQFDLKDLQLKLKGFPHKEKKYKISLQLNKKLQQQQECKLANYALINFQKLEIDEEKNVFNKMQKKQSFNSYSQRPLQRYGNTSSSYSLRQNNLLLRNTFEKYIKKFEQKRKMSYLHSIDQLSDKTFKIEQLVEPNSYDTSQNYPIAYNNLENIQFLQQVVRISRN